jgi:hypothetical protein
MSFEGQYPPRGLIHERWIYFQLWVHLFAALKPDNLHKADAAL